MGTGYKRWVPWFKAAKLKNARKGLCPCKPAFYEVSIVGMVFDRTAVSRVSMQTGKVKGEYNFSYLSFFRPTNQGVPVPSLGLRPAVPTPRAFFRSSGPPIW
eukprot:2614720-Amphidinium_carterae.1